MGLGDRHDLERFISAQAPVYQRAISEIKSGQKRSHWMWYIFPQLKGLGFSEIAQRYAIRGLEEAKSYIQHPVLGARLVECAQALLQVQGRTASEIFGFPDDLKLKSSMTLFALVSESGSVFEQVLEKYYQGQRDEKTLALLNVS